MNAGLQVMTHIDRWEVRLDNSIVADLRICLGSCLGEAARHFHLRWPSPERHGGLWQLSATTLDARFVEQLLKSTGTAVVSARAEALTRAVIQLLAGHIEFGRLALS